MVGRLALSCGYKHGPLFYDLNLAGKTFLKGTPLSRAVDVFKSKYFVRIHKSYSIDTNHIYVFSEQDVTIKDTMIPIGRNYKSELLRLFKFRQKLSTNRLLPAIA